MTLDVWAQVLVEVAQDWPRRELAEVQDGLAQVETVEEPVGDDEVAALGVAGCHEGLKSAVGDRRAASVQDGRGVGQKFIWDWIKVKQSGVCLKYTAWI